MRHLLSILIFLPLIGGILLAFLRSSPESIKRTSFGITLLNFVISIPLFVNFNKATHEMQFVERADWVPAFNIEYAVGVDGISVLFVILTTLLTPLCVLVSWKSVTSRVKEFMVALLVMEAAMIGVFVALDFVLFYVFWEAMLIPMVLMIGVWGGERRIYASVKFFLYTLAGSLLLLVAMIALYFLGGETFNIVKLMDGDYSTTAQFWIFWAFFLAFAIKIPMFPFHTWLPDAHVEAPTAGSVILAGILLKMGGYGFLRFCLPMTPEASRAFSGIILVLSVVAILYGAYMALAQIDLKKLIAYSSVSHMGFVTLGIFVINTQGIEGALMQMINHGIITGAIFLMVGMIYERTHSRLISDHGGIMKPMPKYGVMLVIFVLASLGLPGTNGFVGEFLVLLGSFLKYPGLAALATIGIVLAAVYLLWMLQRVLFGPISKPDNNRLLDLDRREMVILVPLVLLVFWIGFYPDPLLSVMHVSVEHLLDQVHGTEAIRVTEALPGP